MMVEFLFGLLLATTSMLFAYCKIVRISLPGLKNQESFIIIYFLFTIQYQLRRCMYRPKWDMDTIVLVFFHKQ